MSAPIPSLAAGFPGVPIAVATPSPAVPGAALVSRFETALRGPASGDATPATPALNGVDAVVTDAATVPNVTTVPNATTVPNVDGATRVAGATDASGVDGAHAGERILATLHAVSASAGEAWGRMTQFATIAGEPSMAHLLQIQMSAMQASVQFDYVGKIISRSTQNIDQLIKTQ